MKYMNLFIDESGQSNPKAPNSGVYILSGCIVDNKSQEDLKIRSDQIKFKFWDKTNVVFHSRDIGRKERDFLILKDKKILSSFNNNLIQFLIEGNYRMFFILVDLVQAKNKNWNEEKVYQETSRIMVKNFILALLAAGNCRGRIIIESATSKKDFYFHKAASFYLSGGVTETKTKYSEVQQVLTEISFVTKKNYDIEEQIADMLAYGARLKFERKKGKNIYEQKLIKIVQSKLFITHQNAGIKKKKYFSKINSFEILP